MAKGITTKILKNGEKCFFWRFKYLGKTYPVKNMTKLYGCNSISSVELKINEIKLDLSKGLDPFNSQGNSLDDIFKERKEYMIKSKKWRESTADNYTKFYNKHIQDEIGHLKLEKIKYSHLLDIRKNMIDNKGVSKNTLQRILNPIFDEAIKKNEITKSPSRLLETAPIERKEKLSDRSFDDSLEIFVKLYNAIINYKSGIYRNQIEYIEFFKMALFTGHRYGEICQLTKEDVYIKRNLIISPKNITKTNDDYEFPIPKNCLEYIKGIKSGLLFPNINYGSVTGIFGRIINGWKKPSSTKYKLPPLNKNLGADIEIKKGKNITPHDMRTLMMNIMIRNCKIDVMLADYCLEHKSRGIIKHYLDFNYKDKVIAYEKFWDVVNDAIEKTTT